MRRVITQIVSVGLLTSGAARAQEDTDVDTPAVDPAAPPVAPADPVAPAADAPDPNATYAHDDPAPTLIVVTAQLRAQDPQSVPASLTVISGDTLQAAAATHLEDAIRMAPNVDWVGASNRPRFLLIRGVGDLGTGNLITNPSVGVLLDGVDLSGMGAALTTLDVERLEVLRGPQGTLYGPNALGGLFKMTSRVPTLQPSARVEVRFGNHDTHTIEAAAGGRLVPRSDVVSVRAAASLVHTDGWMKNVTLDRSDTAGRDELASRLRVRIDPTKAVRFDLIGSYVDVNDGYDHWSVENNRKTWSDKPGKDQQRTGMGALLARFDVGPVRIESNTSLSTSKWTFTSDWDWIAADTPRPAGSTAPDDYSIDLFNTQITQQDGFTEELRALSRDGRGAWNDRVRWLGGLYAGGTRQQMSTVTEYFGVSDGYDNASDYKRLSAAGFGQLDVDVIDRLTLTAGGRVEHAWQDYSDTNEFENHEDRWLFGWKAAAFARVIDALSLYASGAQSSKLGGFNLATDVPVKTYAPEIDRSFEFGVRSQGADHRWHANGTFFYVARQGEQLSEWVQRPGGDSGDIYFYTDNAKRAHTLGAEFEVSGTPVIGLTLEGALGLLDARIDDWQFQTGTDTIDYSGNVVANAPAATFSAAVSYDSPMGAYGRVGVTGASKRYFANNDGISGDPYALLDLRLGWRVKWFGVSVWGRNLNDARYATTGFGPGFSPNEHYPYGNYYRWGDGASYGLAFEGHL